MILIPAKQMFLRCFMIIGLKHFHNSLKTVVVLAPVREFFPAKYAQFPLRFTE